MMRASTWRSVVMMPDWLPVKLMASPPSSRMAIDSSAIEMRSPAESSMSSSRRGGIRGDLLGHGQELVGRLAHGGDDDGDLVALALRAHDPLGHFTQFLHAGDAAAAVFLDNHRHARTA